MHWRFRLGRLMVAVSVVGALLVASCTTTAVPTSTEPQGTDSKPYGSLILAENFGPGNIDPQTGSSLTFQSMGSAIVESLVVLDINDREVPQIAQRWEISDDGRFHTFFIRKGVKFHDGSDLTGADVKFSIERMLAPEAPHPRAPLWRDAVAKVELKDEYTVVLRMNSPQFELLTDINRGMTGVVPKKYIEVKGVDYFRKNPIGSGPWKFVSFTPGTRLELEAVESHWRAKPQFKSITVLAVPEESTRVAMLRTGELDLADVAVDSAPGLKVGGVRIINYEGGPLYFGWPFFDLSHPEAYALGDVRVRKALQLGINQREIADKLLGGYGRPVAMKTKPTAYFFDPNVLKPHPYDPDGAKKLLAEAGYPSGFNTTLYDVGGGGQHSSINQALSGYWSKIGVKAEIVAMEFAAFRPFYNPKQKPEIWNSIFTYRSANSPGFDSMVSNFHSTQGAPKNLKNPKLDELIDRVPMTKDPAEKKRLALEAAVMARNEYTTLIVVQVDRVLALSAKIGDLERRTDPELSATVFETITHAK